MKINPINPSHNFGLQTDKTFNTIVKKAKAEVFDFDFINPKVWHYTNSAIQKIKKTFPNGILTFKERPNGLIPVLQPKGKLPYYKKPSANKPRTIELKTIMMSNGACHGRDLRNLAAELKELEKKY